MPQPLSKVCSDPGLISLSGDSLVGKPELAAVVTQIIGRWATIDHELGMLLVRLLGADKQPALAIYSLLTGESLQRRALSAAARTVLDDDQFKIFSAVVNVAISAGKKRHKLAHWIWGTCENLPEALLAADPDGLVEMEKFHILAHDSRTMPNLQTEEEARAWVKKFGFDADRIFVYRLPDLQRDLAEMDEAGHVLFWYRQYLRPVFSDAHIREATIADLRAGQPPPTYTHGTSAEALLQLSNLKLFQEARARLEKDMSSNHSSPDGSPPQSGEG